MTGLSREAAWLVLAQSPRIIVCVLDGAGDSIEPPVGLRMFTGGLNALESMHADVGRHYGGPRCAFRSLGIRREVPAGTGQNLPPCCGQTTSMSPSGACSGFPFFCHASSRQA